ncbi:type IV secretory pathway TraG/TraD family ATPase VirD4 [Bradyrhizobium sp. GM6.1]
MGKTSHSLPIGAILHVLYAEADKTLAGAQLGDRVHPVVASAARELLNKSENERSGVLSTTMSFLGLYRDPVVAKVTAGAIGAFSISSTNRSPFHSISSCRHPTSSTQNS